MNTNVKNRKLSNMLRHVNLPISIGQENSYLEMNDHFLNGVYFKMNPIYPRRSKRSKEYWDDFDFKLEDFQSRNQNKTQDE